MSLILRAEVLWRADPAVDAARKMDGWAEFHRAAGKQYLFFDHIERSGRGTDYTAPVFTLTGRDRQTHTAVATGRGKTVIGALADGFRAAALKGLTAPEAESWLARLVNPSVVVPVPVSDFDDILGGEAASDDIEDLLG